MNRSVTLLVAMVLSGVSVLVFGQIPSDLVNKLNGQSVWPLAQIDVASNSMTPAMGWNSWYGLGDVNNGGPNESNLLATADAMVNLGLAAAGYKYVVIDATWICDGHGSRDGNGNLIVDPVRWPHGMKYIADYVHSKGLLMGGYTDIGTVGYGGPSQIGSYGFYQQDADQYAAWGWDFIKIDDHGPGDFAAIVTAIHNNASHRPIVISLCTPTCDGLKFGPRIGNSYRVGGDITFQFGWSRWDEGPDSGLTVPGIVGEFELAQAGWYAQGPGHYGDPDIMLTGAANISDTEGRSQFNLWAILGAPLMIGSDVRPAAVRWPTMSQTTLTTLTNLEVIAVDQDPLCAVGRPVGGTNVYAKPLGSFTSGQLAVLLFNRSSSAATVSINWAALGLVTGSTATVRDLWAHQDLGPMVGGYTSPSIPAHGTMMLKVTGTFDWNRPRSYEAESGYNTLAGTAYYVPHSSNFSSLAHVTGVGQGAANTLKFNNVAAHTSGAHTLDIYYAASSARSAQMSVNGAAAATVAFPSTGSDTQPGFVRMSVTLGAGLNTLLFSNASGTAPNFDRVVVSNALPTNSGAFFVAYNDCAWTDNSGQVPSANDASGRFTTNSPLALPAGYLSDTNGAILPVQVSFTTNAAMGQGFLDRTLPIPVGSDAEYWFAGRIGSNCAVNWTAGHVDMNVSGLDTGRQYNIVLWSTRGTDGASYSNRFTDITLSGADNFTNCSSASAGRLTVSMANDKTRLRSASTPGLVARYDGVKAGSDGMVTITMTAGGDLLWPSAGVSTNGYLNAFAIMTSTNVAPAQPAQTNPPATNLGQNITITAPARAVASAPEVATTRIYREERGTTFYIPYIQTQPTLVVTAVVQLASLPVGGGVRFVLNEGSTNQITQYDLSSPFTSTFINLAKAEYTLDTYIVDSSQNIVSGNSNHDRATHIGIGDILLAIGDSVTAGWDGVVYSNAPYADWTAAPVKSGDNRNFPQVDIYNWITLANDVQMVSHHILLNDKLTTFYGYPVFILNEGVSTIWTGGYLPRMDQQVWQDRINTLHPNKCQIHLGINEAQREKSEYSSNMTQIVNNLITRHGISATNIILAVPAKWYETIWKPTIDSLISTLGISRGPDFQGYYSRNTNPPVQYTTYHPTITGQCQMARLWTLSWIYPRNVSALPTANGITVSWTSLTSVEPSIAGYIVKVGTSPGTYSSTVDVGNVTQHLVAGLTSGQVYYISVSAYDNDAYVPNETKSSGDLQVLNQSGGLQTFTCYNDMGWTSGQLALNITTNTPAALSNGSLKDFATGVFLPVQVSISMPGSTPGDGSANAASPTPGSDAYNVFSNKITCDGYTYWAGGTGPATIQYSGLPTNKLYSFALYMNRGGESEKYSNRWADVAISDVGSFTNTSSPGTTVLSTSLPNDTTRSIMANGAGLLVRFDGINAGVDGDMTVTITPGANALGLGTNVYLNAFMLATSGSNAPAAQTNQTVTNSGWTAYNDCVLDTNDISIATFSTNGPLGPVTGMLKDTNATALPVQVAFSYSGSSAPSMLSRTITAPSGTPADTTFSGYIGPNGAVNWTQGTVSMTLSGMNTGRQYSVVLWSTRGVTASQYSNRWTDIVISGADSFQNNSTAGNSKFTSTQANDGTRVVSVLEGGRLSQYDSIRSGPDGIITFQLTANGLGVGDTNGYLNAFMVQELPVSGGSTNDTNGDGLPDAWEIQYFGGTTVDLNADPDHDGRSNLYEYIAGTSPTSSGSAPEMRIALLNGNVNVEFSGVTQRLYSIDFKTNLMSPWSPLISNIAGSNALQDVRLTAGSGAGYYRFRVRLP